MVVPLLEFTALLTPVNSVQPDEEVGDAHLPLDELDHPIRMTSQLAPGVLADDDVPALLEVHDGGGRVVPVGVRQDGRLAVLVQPCDTGVRRPEIDAEDGSLRHSCCSLPARRG